MIIQCLRGLVEFDDGLLVLVRSRGLPVSEGTYELLDQNYKSVPQLLLKLLRRKSVRGTLAEQVRLEIHLRRERV